MEKHCSRCDRRKTYSDFPPLKRSPDGLDTFCRSCRQETNQIYRKKNIAKIRMQEALFREQNRGKLAAESKEWAKRNPEKVKANCHKYASLNADRRREYNAAWQRANADALRPYYAEKTRRRFAARLRATPAWGDRDAILRIYQECQRISVETGVLHHVDHVVPLISALVCGLHVEYNLQIIPAAENLSKSNKFEVLTICT